MTYCANCEAGLTSTDFSVGFCTQCNQQLSAKETGTMTSEFISDDEYRQRCPIDYAAQQSRKAGWNGPIKPLAQPSEKPASDKWVTCRKHFGVHLERVSCEKPRA